MDREKLFKLINLALDIQERREGTDGFPYVSVIIANYGYNAEITIIDDGFRIRAPVDGCYEFDFSGEISQRQYDTCVKHLEELKVKASGFFEKED